MKKLLDIIHPEERQIVVLSAVAGTTNALVEVSKLYVGEQPAEALNQLQSLYRQYLDFVDELYETDAGKAVGLEIINYHFDLLKGLAGDLFTTVEERIVLAQGELLSTSLYHAYLNERGVRSRLIPALDFMKIDEDNEPLIPYTSERLSAILGQYEEDCFFITQGFICRNSFGEIDNLRRGGSDYTASLIGAAIKAEEIQIWTDIDGMHNNDPRIVSGTRAIANMTFDEAAELAYFGAKILHPQSVFPAQRFNIPLRLLNTMDPSAPGTRISNDQAMKGQVTSIAAKDGITALRIHSSRMLLAYGFLRRVFEVFERFKTPIDMITTSEVAVSLTIDDTRYLTEIMEELKSFGSVEVDTNQSIVCVVGDFSHQAHGFASRVLDAVKHLSIRMISYGGSDFNVSLLIASEDKVEALRSLHHRLF